MISLRRCSKSCTEASKAAQAVVSLEIAVDGMWERCGDVRVRVMGTLLRIVDWKINTLSFPHYYPPRRNPVALVQLFSDPPNLLRH